MHGSVPTVSHSRGHDREPGHWARELGLYKIAMICEHALCHHTHCTPSHSLYTLKHWQPEHTSITQY